MRIHLCWNPIEFKDVEKHWAKRAVNEMGSRMVIEGKGNGMFSPDQNITRAEYAAIVVRGLGLKLERGATPFKDVNLTDWYNGAIHTAYEYGLISGYEDGSFRPNEQITREQAAVIMAKAIAMTPLLDKLPERHGRLPTGGSHFRQKRERACTASLYHPSGSSDDYSFPRREPLIGLEEGFR